MKIRHVTIIAIATYIQPHHIVEAGSVLSGLNNTASGLHATVTGGEDNLAQGPRNFIGGGRDNETTGSYTSVTGGKGNYAAGLYSTVGGGINNASTKYGSTVSGGFLNAADGLDAATVGGGGFNSAPGWYSTVSGGKANDASGTGSAVSGGQYNEASELGATVGGGTYNGAYEEHAVVAGGYTNVASGVCSVIAGGRQNLAEGNHSMVLGGRYNKATKGYALAAGHKARALHSGAFVWADLCPTVTKSTKNNQYVARASGGVKFYTSCNNSAGAKLAPGSGSWSTLSDRDAKEDVVPVEGKDILEMLSAMPISTWKYKTQEEGIRHIGPMAQDFYAAFKLGEDERHISSVDANGIALSAIKGLYEIIQEQDKEAEALKEEMNTLKNMINTL